MPQVECVKELSDALMDVVTCYRVLVGAYFQKKQYPRMRFHAVGHAPSLDIDYQGCQKRWQQAGKAFTNAVSDALNKIEGVDYWVQPQKGTRPGEWSTELKGVLRALECEVHLVRGYKVPLDDNETDQRPEGAKQILGWMNYLHEQARYLSNLDTAAVEDHYKREPAAQKPQDAPGNSQIAGTSANGKTDTTSPATTQTTLDDLPPRMRNALEQYDAACEAFGNDKPTDRDAYDVLEKANHQAREQGINPPYP